MAKVILFGGGDGGGLIITKDGIKPIPPFDPYLLAQIKAVAHLATAAHLRGPGAEELAEVSARVASLAVEQIEAVTGPLDREAGLVVGLDDGDGFVCGSTGKPPIPLSRPHLQVAELV